MNDYSNFTSKDGWNTNVNYNAFSGSYFNGDIDIRGGDLVLRNGNILMSSFSTSNYPYTTSLTYSTVATPIPTLLGTTNMTTPILINSISTQNLLHGVSNLPFIVNVQCPTAAYFVGGIANPVSSQVTIYGYTVSYTKNNQSWAPYYFNLPKDDLNDSLLHPQSSNFYAVANHPVNQPYVTTPFNVRQYLTNIDITFQTDPYDSNNNDVYNISTNLF